MKYLIATLVPLLVSTPLLAQDKFVREANAYYEMSLDELLRIEPPPKAEVGSRVGAREALEAEVPIDVITSAQLESSGYTELGKALVKFVPGYNSPRPSITDGTDHAPPFTLRGLNPDQVLVLINGKRLHQSSLLNVNATVGRGTSGVDINTIPLRAIDRIEVLRDGAAAQYGSDAIAGIINIILKGYGQENLATLSYGQSTHGDGVIRQADVFYTLPLRNDGFINITGEARDRGPTNRAGGDSRDNYRVNHHFGETDTQDGLLTFNAEAPGDDLTLYGHGVVDRRWSSAGAFYRLAGDARNNPNLYPNGFLPLIEPKISDYSATAGIKGVTVNNLKWDLSFTHGYNDFHFYVANSHNDSLGNATPTSFDSGATKYSQQILNLDLVKKLGNVHLAGGAEYRKENYRIERGDEASYGLGSASNLAGAQGFPGFQPQNEVDARRDNRAVYVDAKYPVFSTLTLEGAARYENYSDFGASLDKKGAVSYRPHEDILVRASASTGFRAPSLSQSYYTATTSSRIGGNILQNGTFGVYHPLAVALGAEPLKPEKSTHHTLGLVYQPIRDFSVSADYFDTEIDDRILLTGNITAAVSGEVKAILDQYGVQSARYFTNAVSTRTHGLDLRLNYNHQFEDDSKLKVVASYHRDRTRITRIYPLASILGDQTQAAVINGLTRGIIETWQPANTFKVWTQYGRGRYRATMNLNHFGGYESYYDKAYEFGPEWTFDLDLAYQPTKAVEVAIGAENFFNVTPDRWGNTGNVIASGSGIVQYPQNTPFGYNGAFYYARVSIKF